MEMKRFENKLLHFLKILINGGGGGGGRERVRVDPLNPSRSATVVFGVLSGATLLS